MNNETLKTLLNDKEELSSEYELALDYKHYINYKKNNRHPKTKFSYNGLELGFTLKQIKVLELIAKGFSNAKVAQKLKSKETSVKLLTYRLMKYIERVLSENIDRYHLVIIAQKLNLEDIDLNQSHED